MFEYLRLFAIALILTAVIEVGVAWLLRMRSKKELSAVLLINIITNPLLNYLLLLNGHFHLVSNNLLLVLLLEAGVVLAEWWLLLWVLRREVKKMLALSVAMNACSYLAGWIIFTHIFR